MSNEKATHIARALADSTRLTVLQRLSQGSASVSELVAASGASQSNVSNHLQVLRDSGLVNATRTGRKMVYELADSNVAVLLEAFSALTRPKAANPSAPAIADARTCYDHLAGKLGVEIYQRLERSGVIRIADGEVSLGSNAEQFFDGMGIDLKTVTRAKRKFATRCLDWTEHEHHLGGSLGAALCDRLIQLGCVTKQPGTRAVSLTRKGKQLVAEW